MILAKPHDTLEPYVWDIKTLKLRPEAKKAIQKAIIKLFSNTRLIDKITHVYILGSITGYKWTPESDIDVEVRIPKEFITEEFQERRKATNGSIVYHGHPINLFFTPSESTYYWQDSYFGVYDIIRDEWATPPSDRSKILDPEFEFRAELTFGKLLLDRFRHIIYNYKLAKEKGDRKLESIFYNEAKELATTLDKQRKLSYQIGWGIPRKSWENIVYKLIEHSDVGPEFEYFKELEN